MTVVTLPFIVNFAIVEFMPEGVAQQLNVINTIVAVLVITIVPVVIGMSIRANAPGFAEKMGKPVKILDLAERMIRLSGLEPYKDIDIEITGLRPGEKLYEELLNDSSTTVTTHHPKILISKEPAGDFVLIKSQVKNIIKTATRHRDKTVVSLLKELVPEFISENSEFEELDLKLKPKTGLETT